MLPPTIEMNKNGSVAKSIDQRREEIYHGTAEKVLQEFGGQVIWIMRKLILSRKVNKSALLTLFRSNIGVRPR